MTLFYLGCHRPRWLERTDVPLFISRTVMEKAPGVLNDRLPPSARAMTGLTTRDLPIVPVLQGFEIRDYQVCVDLYERAGVDLTQESVVGLGSVCRRQATEEIDLIASMLHARGLKLHGFGVKTHGLAAYAPCLASADSLAWSYGGRRIKPCAHGRAGSEANCLPFALSWRKRVLDVLASPVQLALPVGAM